MIKLFSLFSLSKIEKKAFVYIFVATLFTMSSLLIANILYSDDLTRVTTGETFWNDNGRPLSTLVSIILQLGQPLTDISPLPQLLAFAIYALSAVFLGKLFQVHNLLLLTLCGIVFVLNPFNLQNFAFVFDSFPMALAILASVLAALSISFATETSSSKQEKIIIFVLGSLFILCSLCLYQAATSVYLVSCFFYGLIQLLDREIKRSLIIFCTTILALFVALIAYVPIKNYYIINSYNVLHSQVVSFSEAPQKAVSNLVSFWRTIQILLGSNNIIINLIVIILIATVILALIKIINSSRIAFYQKKSQLQPLLFVTCLLLYGLLLVVSPLGMMLILENPIFAPRTMMGFSALVTICCLFLSNEIIYYKSQKVFKYCLTAFFSLIILAFANVSFTLGNVLYTQNIQDEIIVTVLISDLGEIVPQLPISLQHPTLAVVNSLEYTYGNTKAYSKYPLLKDITWFYLRTNSIHFYTKLETLGFRFTRPHYEKHVFTSPDKQFVPTNKPVVTRPLYNIYFENNDLLVVVLQNPIN